MVDKKVSTNPVLFWNKERVFQPDLHQDLEGCIFELVMCLNALNLYLSCFISLLISAKTQEESLLIRQCVVRAVTGMMF